MRCGSRILDGARGYERAIGRWLAGLLSCLMQEVRPLAPQRQEGHRSANASADGNGSNRRPRKLPNEETTSQVNFAGSCGYGRHMLCRLSNAASRNTLRSWRVHFAATNLPSRTGLGFRFGLLMQLRSRAVRTHPTWRL